MKTKKKIEVSEITPEELLSRMQAIFEKTINEAIEPKPEKYVGVSEVSEFCGESQSWVYQKCKEKFLPHIKTSKNASYKFKLSEIAKVMEKYRIESRSSAINYTIDKDGNIIN